VIEEVGYSKFSGVKVNTPIREKNGRLTRGGVGAKTKAETTDFEGGWEGCTFWRGGGRETINSGLDANERETWHVRMGFDGGCVGHLIR